MKREGRVHRKNVNVLTAALIDKESLIISVFSSHSRIYHPCGDLTITGEGLQISTYARPLFSVPHPISYAGLSFVTSANLSGFLNNLKKWERIENGLNKRFFIKVNLQKRSPPPKSHIVITRQKNIRNIMGTFFHTVSHINKQI